MKRKIKVEGQDISIITIDDNDFISLTDIAKQGSDQPRYVIQNWMKNTNTIRFLYAWESLHNAKFKRIHLDAFISEASNNRIIFSPEKWIDMSGAIGMMTKRGRYGGGTYAHSDIALEFCSWLSPEFKVYILKEFQRLKREEYRQKDLEWHISKITDNIDEIRNLLDTIPGQSLARNRLNNSKDNI